MRVTDAAIERVGAIFGETNDVGSRLAAGQLPKQACDAGANQNNAQPRQQALVETALEQIEGERARRDEEHENPDRPVIEAVMQLVANADLPLGIELDP